ncbi:MAG: choice-of-anchor V domain-containing protein [Bacteroidota bacterium]
MKRTSTFLSFLVIAAAIISLANSSGAPPGRTGAPGESTCGASGCHGVATNQGSANISLDFQEGTEAYQAGETYKVKFSISDGQNQSKNGFEIVALDENENNVGEWILTLSDDTRLRPGSNRDYVTHTRDGNTRDNWEVDWKAPAESAGAVTFYLAVLDANGNGGSSGDLLYTTDVTVNVDVSSSTALINKKNIHVYPNPAVDILNIEEGSAKIKRYQLFNVAGKLVREDIYNRSIEVDNLDNGLYVLRLETSEGIVHQKVMIE